MSSDDAAARFVRGVQRSDALDPRVIDAMVRECARVGMTGITEANWPEFAARSRLWRRLRGKTELAADDVQRFIGLQVDAPEENLASWAIRQAEELCREWAVEFRASQETAD
jgi:hypothetical protein